MPSLEHLCNVLVLSCGRVELYTFAYLLEEIGREVLCQDLIIRFADGCCGWGRGLERGKLQYISCKGYAV